MMFIDSSKRRIVLGIAALAIIAGGVMAPVLATTPFVSETVEATADLAGFTSLALDGQGNPHISYYYGTNADLKYAVKSGGVWITDTVDATGGVGLYTSIALDGQGAPHISYLDATNRDLKYAVKTNGTWTTETVDATGDVGRYTSIALDVQGNPHISYYDGTNFDLKYAVKSGGVWQTPETVDWTGIVGRYTSIALDGQGNPHISYHDVTNDDLKYAVKTNGTWTTETVDATGDMGQYTSLALDGRGAPHISYQDASNGDLKYAVKSGGFWFPVTVDWSGGGSHTSLALDGQGNPHISYYSYYDVTDYGLMYTVKNGGGWNSEKVQASNISGVFTSIALDGKGNPCISYYDDSNGDLWYADSAVHLKSPVGGERWNSGGQATVTWDGLGTVDVLLSQDGGATYVTMEASVSGGAALVNVPAWNTETARVKIVRNSPYSTSESPGLFTIGLEKTNPWWTTVADAGPNASYTSLALGAEGIPHISYDAGDLMYAVKSGDNWITETVDVTGGRSSLALDGQGNPHISYFHYGNLDLMYAVKNGGGWTTELVDATGIVGQYTSLALDGQGNPHISYWDLTNADLKYAVKSGGVWQTPETVDATGEVGYFTSIALDGLGAPHISYYDNSNSDVKYAVKNGGIWNTETVDGTGYVGQFTSLALDGQGNPHISYSDNVNDDLMYAVKIGDSWTTERVDEVGEVGWYTSLALDAQDTPQISYYDVGNGDLKYAVKSGSSWNTETVDSAGDVGKYGSLALDAQDNPRVSYADLSTGVLKYASAAVELADPSPGVTWPVGAARAVTWDGEGVIDIWLSVDGGVQYDLLASNISNGDYMLTVPHTPSRFCKVKLERRVEANTHGAYYYLASISVNDSFFTIETSVSLLSMMVVPATAGAGNMISWSTDPGPEDLDGYRLEKRRGTSDWLTLVSLTKDTSHHDAEGSSGDSYRLFAVNGLGEELYLGEASDGNVPSFGGRLVAWPVPFRSGDLNVSFPASVGGVPVHTEVAVYDVAGRHVKTLFSGSLTVAVGRRTWDGRDEGGKLVASGIYFIRATSGVSQQTRKLVIVR